MNKKEIIKLAGIAGISAMAGGVISSLICTASHRDVYNLINDYKEDKKDLEAKINKMNEVIDLSNRIMEANTKKVIQHRDMIKKSENALSDMFDKSKELCTATNKDCNALLINAREIIDELGTTINQLVASSLTKIKEQENKSLDNIEVVIKEKAQATKPKRRSVKKDNIEGFEVE